MLRYYQVTYLFLFLFLLGSLLVGCAHIPKESVQLSQELTNMINSAQAAHIAMLDEYMAERRHKVDLFMEEKWIPKFMSKFVYDPEVLNDIKAANTAEEKGKIVLEVAEAASKQIFNRRAALMDALDEVEHTLKDAIQAHYADMLMINQALTAHLRAAAEVTATREELLKQLKIEPMEILPIDKINSSIEKILSFEGNLKELPDIVKEVRTTIRE